MLLDRRCLDGDPVAHLHRLDRVQVTVLVAVLPDFLFQEPLGLIGRIHFAPIGSDEPVPVVVGQFVSHWRRYGGRRRSGPSRFD